MSFDESTSEAQGNADGAAPSAEPSYGDYSPPEASADQGQPNAQQPASSQPAGPMTLTPELAARLNSIFAPPPPNAPQTPGQQPGGQPPQNGQVGPAAPQKPAGQPPAQAFDSAKLAREFAREVGVDVEVVEPFIGSIVQAAQQQAAKMIEAMQAQFAPMQAMYMQQVETQAIGQVQQITGVKDAAVAKQVLERAIHLNRLSPGIKDQEAIQLAFASMNLGSAGQQAGRAATNRTIQPGGVASGSAQLSPEQQEAKAIAEWKARHGSNG